MDYSQGVPTPALGELGEIEFPKDLLLGAGVGLVAGLATYLLVPAMSLPQAAERKSILIALAGGGGAFVGYLLFRLLR